MRGRVLGYSVVDKSGDILGFDGNRYHFEKSDLKDNVDYNDVVPQKNDTVDFLPSGQKAVDIYLVVDVQEETNKIIYAIISILTTLFLGVVGTIISRLVIAGEPFGKHAFAIIAHLLISIFFIVPILGWVLYMLASLYFVITNYQIVMRPKTPLNNKYA